MYIYKSSCIYINKTFQYRLSTDECIRTLKYSIANCLLAARMRKKETQKRQTIFPQKKMTSK